MLSVQLHTLDIWSIHVLSVEFKHTYKHSMSLRKRLTLQSPDSLAQNVAASLVHLWCCKPGTPTKPLQFTIGHIPVLLCVVCWVGMIARPLFQTRAAGVQTLQFTWA